MDQQQIAEKQKYEKMWSRDEYRERSPGFRLCAKAYDLLKPEAGQSLCDYGAGTGRASAWFKQQGLNVTALDIAANAVTEFDGDVVEACLWQMPAIGVFDYGYCCDVMEHLPTDRVPAALRGIAERTTRAAFFQIALFECHMGDAIGEHLHLTVKPAQWWHAALKRHFRVVETHALPPSPSKYVIAVCRP